MRVHEVTVALGLGNSLNQAAESFVDEIESCERSTP